jgi:THO complex subunit 7
MAAHYAISPMEDDVVIKQRLLTRTTTTRGEPPLKKLIKKFIAFATEIEKEGNNFSDCEKLYKSFLQELATFELPLLKTKAVIEANRREQESFKNLHVELNNQIAQAQKDIEVLKVQLEEAKIERQHKEECEAIRRLIAAQPPRAETQRQLNELEKELVGMEAENFAASRTLELRKKQFGLLLHVVDELQSTLEEEKNPVDPDVGMVGTSSVGADGSTSEPMVIDT